MKERKKDGNVKMAGENERNIKEDATKKARRKDENKKGNREEKGYTKRNKNERKRRR